MVISAGWVENIILGEFNSAENVVAVWASS